MPEAIVESKACVACQFQETNGLPLVVDVQRLWLLSSLAGDKLALHLLESDIVSVDEDRLDFLSRFDFTQAPVFDEPEDGHDVTFREYLSSSITATITWSDPLEVRHSDILQIIMRYPYWSEVGRWSVATYWASQGARAHGKVLPITNDLVLKDRASMVRYMARHLRSAGADRTADG